MCLSNMRLECRIVHWESFWLCHQRVELRTLIELGSCTGPPALCWPIKDATTKDVSGAAWKNFVFWAFHAPFSGSGLHTHEQMHP